MLAQKPGSLSEAFDRLVATLGCGGGCRATLAKPLTLTLAGSPARRGVDPVARQAAPIEAKPPLIPVQPARLPSALLSEALAGAPLVGPRGRPPLLGPIAERASAFAGRGARTPLRPEARGLPSVVGARPGVEVLPLGGGPRPPEPLTEAINRLPTLVRAQLAEAILESLSRGLPVSGGALTEPLAERTGGGACAARLAAVHTAGTVPQRRRVGPVLGLRTTFGLAITWPFVLGARHAGDARDRHHADDAPQ